jgi:hypothetical protein
MPSNDTEGRWAPWRQVRVQSLLAGFSNAAGAAESVSSAALLARSHCASLTIVASTQATGWLLHTHAPKTMLAADELERAVAADIKQIVDRLPSTVAVSYHFASGGLHQALLSQARTALSDVIVVPPSQVFRRQLVRSLRSVSPWTPVVAGPGEALTLIHDPNES